MTIVESCPLTLPSPTLGRGIWGSSNSRFIRALFVLLFVWGPQLCWGDENQLFSPDYLRRSWEDLKELPTKPFHWSSREWWVTGGILTGTFSSFAIDGSIRQYFRDHRNKFSDGLSAAFTHFGDYRYQIPLHLSAWFLGTVFDYAPLKKSAADGAEASLFAAGMITPLLVRITGRELPETNEHPLKFRPFVPNRCCFPSGHTTEAFAVATVLDFNFRETFGYWHSPFLYGIAAATGASRIYDHKHYLSDVILGAGIGWSVGYWLATKPRNQIKVSWDPRRPGLLWSWAF
ncbi:MAG: phosphatase PAP2 family protein [Elusimicrobia bacterium]|nr:phosphatase PAP2 family protein [Elusimicrobiota bacterium]